MALASLTLQGASFIMIFMYKSSMTGVAFSNIIVQISWAAVVGSICTFRLEILLPQRDRGFKKETFIAMGGTALITIIVSSLIAAAYFRMTRSSGSLVIAASFLALGFGLTEAQYFVSAHTARFRLLLLTRFFQAAGIITSGFLAYFHQSELVVFWAYALAFALPVLLWLFQMVYTTPGNICFELPDRFLFFRGAALNLSTVINSVYANAPVLIAASTQPAAFVADFGFVMKILTGPISLIRQAVGQSYLSRSLSLTAEPSSARHNLMRITLKALAKSTSLYLIIISLLGLAIFIRRDQFHISHPGIFAWLSCITVLQVGVNTIAGVRTPLHIERRLLIFDAIRVCFLLLILTMMARSAFLPTLSITSSSLYFAYLMIILSYVKTWKPKPTQEIDGQVIN